MQQLQNELTRKHRQDSQQRDEFIRM